MKDIYAKMSISDYTSYQNSFLQQLNIFFIKPDHQKLLDDYVKEVNEKYRSYESLNLYPEEAYSEYQPKVIYPDKTVPKIHLNMNIVKGFFILDEIVKKLLKIFIVVGLMYLIIAYKRKSKIDIVFKCFSFWFLLMVLTMTIIPSSTKFFSIQRLYQQALIFLSFSAVTGGIAILRFVNVNKRIGIVSSIFILYFAFTSGFIPQIIGHSDALLQLNNKGYDYDWSYTHDTDVYSAHWLKKNYDSGYYVYADDLANLRLYSYASIDNAYTDLLPTTIDKNAYVYFDFPNTVLKKIYLKNLGRGYVAFTSPEIFIKQEKNLIYTNGGSEIYK